MKYKKRLPRCEAMEWNGRNTEEVIRFIERAERVESYSVDRHPMHDVLHIIIGGGKVHTIRPTDMIVLKNLAEHIMLYQDITIVPWGGFFSEWEPDEPAPYKRAGVHELK